MSILGYNSISNSKPYLLTGVQYEDKSSYGDFIKYDMIKNDSYIKGWFASKDSIILGVAPDYETRNGNGCHVEWHFRILKIPPKLISASLNINTLRTHAGLHTRDDIAIEAETNKNPKKACISINGSILDCLDIVRRMENGREYGFNKVKVYQISDFIENVRNDKNEKLLKISIEVDPLVYWDIDSISIDSISYEKFKFHTIYIMIFSGVIGFFIKEILGLLQSLIKALFKIP